MAENNANTETFAFQAEINQLMSLIINAFYSNRDVFLRELISNASDAIDKARHEALRSGKTESFERAIRIIPNKDEHTLTIQDDGVGMTRAELISNLGTIARSGTKAFMEALAQSQNTENNMNLIGQFGVGFYSAFLAADRVTVVSRASPNAQFYRWESTAGGTFTIVENEDLPMAAGSVITLHLREDATEYLTENKIRELVAKHNAYITYPIYLSVEREVEETIESAPSPTDDKEVDGTVEEKDKDDAETKTEKKLVKRKEWSHLNSQKPIWMKAPEDVSQDEHDAFYKYISNDWEGPLTHQFIKAEGSVEFRGILYSPRRAPFDMFQSRDNKRRNIKLFVRRVFITDDCEAIVPEWLSFVKGIIDSDDLPLNISREMLQQNRIMKVIQKNVVKKAIEMIQDLATDKPDDFKLFYESFSKNIKLGVYDDDKNREKLVELLRFYSSHDSETMTSLLDYTTRAKEGQTKIYYITGDNVEVMRKSPFIERLIAKGYEVIFMKDAIDEYMTQRLTEYTPSGTDKKFTFVNVTKEGNLFDDDNDVDSAKACEKLCSYIKEVLADKVEKVQVSTRLAKAPAAIVTGAYGWTANMERIMKAQALQANMEMQFMKPKRVLEINPEHAIVKALIDKHNADKDAPTLKELVMMLFDTTMLASGFSMDDTMAYADRIYRLMSAGMAGEDIALAEADEKEVVDVSDVETKMEDLD